MSEPNAARCYSNHIARSFNFYSYYRIIKYLYRTPKEL